MMNIIMFNVEDNSARRYGCYGGQALTPHVDAFAKEGVLFENCSVSTPVCNPSRTAWLTGLRANTSGVFGNSNDWHMATDMIDVTLPKHLRDNGYQTVQAGKMFHKGNAGRVYTDDTNSFEITLEETVAGRPKYGNGGSKGVTGYKWDDPDIPIEYMHDGHLTDNIIDYLQNGRDSRPFFMGVGYHSPHLDFVVPKSFFDSYDPASIQMPDPVEPKPADFPMTDSQWKDFNIAHLATISVVDECFGRVIQTLKDLGLYDNTIIVYSTDHGFMLGEHWLFSKSQNKHWNETIQVPYIWRIPGVTPADTRCSAMVETIDSFPTFFDYAGIAPPAGQILEGHSMRRVLENPAKQFKKANVVMGSIGVSKCTERYRLNTDWDGNVTKFFDHKSDPDENVNLKDNPAYADVIAKIKSYGINEVWPDGPGNK
jgi:arylsulfatase A-like enzyme